MSQQFQNKDVNAKQIEDLLNRTGLFDPSGPQIQLKSLDTSSFSFGAFNMSKRAKILLIHTLVKIIVFLMNVITKGRDGPMFFTCLILTVVEYFVVKEILGRIMIDVRWWSILTPEGKRHDFVESSKKEGNGETLTINAYWVLHLVSCFAYSIVFIIYLCSTYLQWILLALGAALLNLLVYMRFKSIQLNGNDNTSANQRSAPFKSEENIQDTEEFDRAAQSKGTLIDDSRL